MAGSPVWAENWKITPQVSLSETLTDNATLAPSGSKRGDLVTEVVPTISIDGAGARVKLHLDYQLDNLLYARDSSRNNTQNYLAALGTLEAIERWLFVEARGSITQQNISAFGSQAPSNASVNPNRAETAVYQVSPYIRGQFGSTAEYLLRFNWTTTTSKSDVLTDTGVNEWVGNIKGSTPLTALVWSVDGNNQKYYYNSNLARDTEASRLRGFLTYQLEPQFRVSVTGGRESNNFLSADQQGKTTSGFGFEWTPTERTQVSALREKRFFGDGHSLTIRHRTPQTSWSFSDSRDVNTLPNQLITAGLGTAFDLLFNALTTRIPDPVARAREAEQLLLQEGIPLDLAVRSAFLSSRVFQDRHREASVGLLGARNTVTLTAYSSERSSIGSGAGTLDDFALSPNVEQRGINADWSHKLSPLSSLSVLAWWVRSTGSSSAEDTKQWSLRMLLSTQLGPKSFGTIGVRHVRFDNTGDPQASYRENAVTASVSLQF